MTMYEKVLEFMKKHDQATREKFGIPDPDVVLLRVRLVIEETAELCIALHKNDLIGIMDACADLRYVVVGTAIAYGLPSLELFGTSEPGLKASEAYQAGSWSKVIYFSRLNRLVNCLVHSMSNSLGMLSFSEFQEIGREIQTEINEVLREIGYIDAMYQIPAKEVFAEVHRSNMTKNKLDKHSKGGKVGKKGFTAPDFKQFTKP